MTLVRIAEIEIHPDSLEAYKVLLAKVTRASVAAEPGVIFLHAVSLKDNPNMIRVFECYADQRAYETHLQAPHFLGYKEAVAGMVKSLRLLDAEAISLATKSG